MAPAIAPCRDRFVSAVVPSCRPCLAFRTSTYTSAVDAPLDGAACSRLARRVGLGLGRVGSTAGHTSGEIFLAAATGARADRQGRIAAAGHSVQGTDLGPFFEAVVDASEEAVLNSLFMAETVTGRSGHVRYALPADAVREILGQ